MRVTAWVPEEGAKLYGRSQLVQSNFVDCLRRTNVSIWRRIYKPKNANNQTKEFEKENGKRAVIQLLMVKPDSLLVSAAVSALHLPKTAYLPPDSQHSTSLFCGIVPSATSSPQQGNFYGHQPPYIWQQGLIGIPAGAETKTPPSRAYQKLASLLVVIGELPKPGSLVVDLGSAPGGWTHILANDLVNILFTVIYSYYFIIFIIFNIFEY